ncbi:hypothetical protein E2C01_007316 [Portunus trituberculatus]|uniref:Uncharacterized protein n=1 Tax=Portunus trituberculatus TaxID=210409 RepID=A0A5B7CXK1_PORTR|nr:hypothetical protein [Portunus trituberculatus]
MTGADRPGGPQATQTLAGPTRQGCLISAGNSIGTELDTLEISRIYNAAPKQIQLITKEASGLVVLMLSETTRVETVEVFGLGKVKLPVHSGVQAMTAVASTSPHPPTCLVLVATGPCQLCLFKGLPDGQHGGGSSPAASVLFVLLSVPQPRHCCCTTLYQCCSLLFIQNNHENTKKSPF